jgi:hypothetical protein
MRTDVTLDARERNNVIFYVAMRVAAIASGKKNLSAIDVAAIELTKLDSDAIKKSLSVVKRLYDDLGGGDQVAKGSQLVELLKAEINALFVGEIISINDQIAKK